MGLSVILAWPWLFLSIFCHLLFNIIIGKRIVLEVLWDLVSAGFWLFAGFCVCCVSMRPENIIYIILSMVGHTHDTTNISFFHVGNEI